MTFAQANPLIWMTAMLVVEMVIFAHREARPLPTTPAGPYFPRRERFLTPPPRA